MRTEESAEKTVASMTRAEKQALEKARAPGHAATARKARFPSEERRSRTRLASDGFRTKASPLVQPWPVFRKSSALMRRAIRRRNQPRQSWKCMPWSKRSSASN